MAKNVPMDPLVASLMPESDKKMGAIAGISLVVALAICMWASMYEALQALDADQPGLHRRSARRYRHG